MTNIAFSLRLRPAILAPVFLAIALTVPASLVAEERATQPTVSEKTSEAFSKLQPLVDAKNWDGILAILDKVIPTVDPMSFDMFKMLDMEGKIYVQKEQGEKALAAWEGALKISDVKNYYEPRDLQQTLLYSAQVAYQQATASKVSPAVQQSYFGKAVGFFRRYIESVKVPPPDIQMLFASLLYNQAVSDPTHIDLELLKQAKVEVEKCLTASIHPKPDLYLLLLSILQQQNDYPHTAEILEFILSQNPNKKDYWAILWSLYVAMASESKDPADVRANYIRAINTAERALAYGALNSPKDRLQTVNLYLNLGQFGKGTDMLYKGLKDKTIESDPKNWLVLGYYYQQANRDEEAIVALKEASALFPDNGQIDLTIAEIYRGQDNLKECIDFYRSALKKGNLDKPFSVWVYLANALFTVEQIDEAKVAIDRAAAFPEAAQDKFMPQLKDAIYRAISERDAQKPAIH